MEKENPYPHNLQKAARLGVLSYYNNTTKKQYLCYNFESRVKIASIELQCLWVIELIATESVAKEMEC